MDLSFPPSIDRLWTHECRARQQTLSSPKGKSMNVSQVTNGAVCLFLTWRAPPDSPVMNGDEESSSKPVLQRTLVCRYTGAHRSLTGNNTIEVPPFGIRALFRPPGFSVLSSDALWVGAPLRVAAIAWRTQKKEARTSRHSCDSPKSCRLKKLLGIDPIDQVQSRNVFKKVILTRTDNWTWRAEPKAASGIHSKLGYMQVRIESD